MKKLLVFLVGMVLFVQHGQAQVVRHFWLNPMSYNHTLSPTSDGGYILAAARDGQWNGFRNTIAVFKLDNAYNIQNTRIIGLPGGTGFDVNVNFEVHDVTEHVSVDDDGNVTSHYVICGSISSHGNSSIGMVAIVDMGLNVQSIREYPNAEVFYSVYADGNYFYVCGKTPTNEGIVMRDFIFPIVIPPVAYVTRFPWEYHKVKVNNFGRDIVVSGTDYSEVGFTAFNIAGGAFIQIISQQFFISQPPPIPPQPPRQLQPNSKVVVANDPNNLPRGFILSAMTFSQNPPFGEKYEILTYVFNTYTAFSSGHVMELYSYGPSPRSVTVLEDMNTVPVIGTNSARIAWVGYTTILPASMRGAFYITTNLPFLPSQPADYFYFPTFVNPPRYSQLHKVHYHNGNFHCGGYYTHDNANNDKTTFVAAPERMISNPPALSDCAWIMQLEINPLPLPQITPFSPTQMTVRVNFNTWHQIKGDFCTTDCDDTPLYLPANNNCGNRP